MTLFNTTNVSHNIKIKSSPKSKKKSNLPFFWNEIFHKPNTDIALIKLKIKRKIKDSPIVLTPKKDTCIINFKQKQANQTRSLHVAKVFQGF